VALSSCPSPLIDRAPASLLLEDRPEREGVGVSPAGLHEMNVTSA
jgi:hypothetical protein